jgi:5-methyltetrahydropteroyltriglutamate--homocysteine methyltransferase
MARPFFRADQVGSLLRPPALIDAREAFAHGRIDAARLREAEDGAIAACVRQQEAIGLPVVVDGEFRRENWWIDFISKLGGVQIHEGDGASFVRTAPAAGCCDAHTGDHHASGPGASSRDTGTRGASAHDAAPHLADDQAADADAGWRYVPKNVYTAARLEHTQPVLARDYAYLQGIAQRPAKVTLPSPSRMHFHGGRRAVSRDAYPDIEAFFDDVVRVWRREIAALEAAGCRYIQLDDPLLTYFIADRMREDVKREGDDPDRRLARYVRLVNDCIAARGPDTAIGVHVCRGNSRSGWITEGGYARIAEQVLGGLEADHLLLEYDDERSGDFEPLARVPRGRRVVLGLVTTKHGRLERQDDLLRRIDDASRFVPKEHLAISPQCGFASTVEGNVITPDDQWKKLELVVRTAERAWGRVV